MGHTPDPSEGRTRANGRESCRRRAKPRNLERRDVWRLYPPPAKEWEPLDAELASRGADDGLDWLAKHAAEAVFDRAGRDAESIGLSMLAPDAPLTGSPLPEQSMTEVLMSAVRILGLAGRYQGGRQGSSSPQALRDYLEAVADHQGLEPSTLIQFTQESLRRGRIIDTSWQLATRDLDVSLRLRPSSEMKHAGVAPCVRASTVTLPPGFVPAEAACRRSLNR